jgi:hypothetical protein
MIMSDGLADNRDLDGVGRKRHTPAPTCRVVDVETDSHESPAVPRRLTRRYWANWRE